MRPHDLLRLAKDAELRYEGLIPGWVPAALARAPWVVVVRRALTPTALIPVGVRGNTRAERLAAFLDPTAVTARVTPEDLANVRAWRQTPATHSADDLLCVLDTAEELFASQGLVWGPTGSVGFELATGIATVGPTSDLDMVVRAPEPWPPERARGLADALARLPMCVDVQLDTPAGAVALTEYARGGRVLLRTPDGPKLVRDPWERITADRQIV